jgi:hypothetical protein
VREVQAAYEEYSDSIFAVETMPKARLQDLTGRSLCKTKVLAQPESKAKTWRHLMVEFDNLEVKKFVDHSDSVRTEKLRKALEKAEQERHEQAVKAQVVLAEKAEIDDRSSQLFHKLKAYEHHKISTGQELTVVMEDIDRDGSPSWALIRVDGASGTPRHGPAPRATPEWVVAVRCQSKPKFQLRIFPLKNQNDAASRVYNDPRELFERISQEIGER